MERCRPCAESTDGRPPSSGRRFGRVSDSTRPNSRSKRVPDRAEALRQESAEARGEATPLHLWPSGWRGTDTLCNSTGRFCSVQRSCCLNIQDAGAHASPVCNVDVVLRTSIIAAFQPQPRSTVLMYYLHLSDRGPDVRLVSGPTLNWQPGDRDAAAVRC